MPKYGKTLQCRLRAPPAHAHAPSLQPLRFLYSLHKHMLLPLPPHLSPLLPSLYSLRHTCTCLCSPNPFPFHPTLPMQLAHTGCSRLCPLTFHSCCPPLQLAAHVQPITRSLLKFEVTITPDFKWEDKLHGAVEPFWLMVEDQDGENILYHQYWVLKKSYAEEVRSGGGGRGQGMRRTRGISCHHQYWVLRTFVRR